MRLVILGPPGSGKGTHSKILSKKLGLKHISTGDVIREEIKKQTDFGKKCREFVKKGKLVPDEIIISILKSTLPDDDFILDGFPRTLNQAKMLDTITNIDKVIFMEVSDDEIVSRLSSRLQCPRCGRIYGKDIKPRSNNLCDFCNTKLVRRNDDKPNVIKQRLRVYHKTTEPLIKYYEKKGILKHVNAQGDVAEVATRVYNAIIS